MFDGGEYTVRQRLTAEGTRYRVFEEEDPILAWTHRKYDLGVDVELTTPGGEAVLRLTREPVADAAVPDRSLALSVAVVDERTGEVVGMVRRDWQSLVRRHWTLLDPQGLEVAGFGARSRLLSAFRQQFTTLVPYWYRLRSAEGEAVGDLRGSLAPRYGYVLSLGSEGPDCRLALAASVVVDALETI